MAEYELEFASVPEAKDFVEKRINKIKQSLDIRLGRILAGLSEIEVKIDESSYNTELESLKGYRQQTISLFGPNAPNIEIIDKKISEIESLSETRNKPIKLKWDDTEFLVLISELGYVETPQPGRNALAPPNTYKTPPYDDVIISKQLDIQSQSETEHNSPNSQPTSGKKHSFGDIIVQKPSVSRKPVNVNASHSNIRKSVSIDSNLESKSQREVLRFMSLAPDMPQPEETTGPSIPIRHEASPKLVFSREPSPKVDNSELEPEGEYTNMSRQAGPYYTLPSDASPTQTTSPPALQSISSLPLPELPLPAVLKKGDSSGQDGTLGLRPTHDYEEIDISLEGLTQSEKNPSKKCRFPRFPSGICCPEGTEKGQIMKPKAVCVNRSNGNLYVAEKGNSRVQVFSPSGEHISLFADKAGGNKMVTPYGICLVSNQVYVTQSSTHCVHIYTLNGVFVKKFGKEGSTDGKFKLPSNITASQLKKQIYVCDTGNDRVQAFDFSHSFIRHFGVGQLLKPVDIELDSGGRIVVLDRGPKCIHLFSISGERLFSLIAFSTFRQVVNPLFFTLDQDDVIYLSDYARNCVFVYTMDGGLKGQIGEDGVFVEPRGLVFDNSGRLVVVSCNHTGCLQFYDL